MYVVRVQSKRCVAKVAAWDFILGHVRRKLKLRVANIGQYRMGEMHHACKNVRWFVKG